MDLMERLEKTANEFSPAQLEYEEAQREYGQYDNKNGLRAAVGLGGLAAGTGAGLALARKAKMNPAVGGTLSGALGAGVAMAGQVPINDHLNATQPGRKEALDRYLNAANAAGERLASDNLMDRLEKTANVAAIEDEYNAAKAEYDQYDNKSGLRAAVAGTGVGLGIGAGAAAGAGNRVGRGLGGAVGGVAGLAAGIAGQIPINNHLNATQPGREQAWDRYSDAADAYDDHYMAIQNARQGAGSVSHAAAGADKTASDLLDELDKTAANVFGKVKDTLYAASGKGVKDAKELKGQMNRFDASKGDIGSQTAANGKRAQGIVDAEKAKANKARLQVGGVAAGGAAATGAGVAFANRNQEEKTASEILDELEKTAANVLGKAKGFASNLKNDVVDASGVKYRGAKKNDEKLNTSLNALGGPKGLTENTAVKKSENLVNNTKADRDAARKKLAPAAIGAAGVTGVGAGAALANNDDQQKTAGEQFMNELFKEAATAIIQEEMPAVKVHRDPMDGIKFRR